ncbi:hypothetical protein BWQ96_08399 [Gracilariopsis chorda]|uniref:Uncharacterized protein n=1 Tax=Gracilariopsis chorda TaxID=448386 RepID=A0A2V3IIE7_9FLOR|nr:hypothetical protein BWQ96_08399 [Gracilariopsis chorda]|eukprot:PXF41864.1 hypothetical protein BWQ96_08399 [Gracilariopsis chorda]
MNLTRKRRKASESAVIGAKGGMEAENKQGESVSKGDRANKDKVEINTLSTKMTDNPECSQLQHESKVSGMVTTEQEW